MSTINDNPDPKSNSIAYESCPHCGHKLSPWQQVLLSVDRMLTCKNCWYRISLDVFEEEEGKPGENKEEEQNSEGN
jgi:DNA-directed RNA polymerase subunit RPC12/RpoP